MRAASPVRLGLLLVVGLSMLAMGCEERGVSEKRLPKGAEAIAEATDASPHALNDEGAGADRAGSSDATAAASPWSVPEGWRRVADDSPMRLATYAVTQPDGEVEVRVSRFPGEVGGELANINRWRNEIGLDPIDEGQLDGIITRLDGPGYDGYRVRMRGSRLILVAAAVHEAARDRTWFVKAVVPSATAVDDLEQQIVGFAVSLVDAGQTSGEPR